MLVVIMMVTLHCSRCKLRRSYFRSYRKYFLSIFHCLRVTILILRQLYSMYVHYCIHGPPGRNQLCFLCQAMYQTKQCYQNSYSEGVLSRRNSWPGVRITTVHSGNRLPPIQLSAGTHCCRAYKLPPCLAIMTMWDAR